MGRRGRPPYPDLLTPRQQEVLTLVREGLTNREIAERLDITPDGAKFHVSEILTKIGVRSREEAARWRDGAPTAALHPRSSRWSTGARRPRIRRLKGAGLAPGTIRRHHINHNRKLSIT
jgi:DNA-binding CsgD family transcriptional regulator